jgi:ABC-type multidrug transport system ATPase subunit
MSLDTRAIHGTSATPLDQLSRDSSNFDGASITKSEVRPSELSSKASLPSVVESMAEDEFGGLSLRAVAPVGINVRDLTLGIDLAPSGIGRLAAAFKSKKQRDLTEPRSKSILNNVNADIPSGSLTAILGASGSGKTSLLNTMSQRMSGSRLKKTGDILYNGDAKLSSIRSAYVMQRDVLLPTLTVRETLKYSAELRLPPPVTSEERGSIVEEILLELGLKECADTRIGNNERKGCSGGEKRRTSLGVQLLANPSVLFLDEVTTGLDATSALQLIQTLKDLTRKGRTIIVTLHQPRSEIWGLFDHLILLTGGSPVYSGPTDSCLSYFEKLGYTLPSFVNPAEYLIDLAAIDTRSQELEEQSLTRVQKLMESWKASSLTSREKETVNTETRSIIASVTSRSSFSRQLRVQTARTMKTTWRDPLGMSGSLIEAIFMGVITGWVFLNQDESLTGIRSREGSLYTAAAFQGFLILIFETYRLTLDIPTFDREHAEGVVGVSSFLLSRRLARMFIEDIPVPLIFSAAFYFLAGFRHLASQFFTFFALLFLSQYLSVTFAMFCVSLSRNFAGASLIANLNFTVQSLCSK